MDIVCRIAETDEERKTAFRIRREVFVVGQNVPDDIEYDEYDEAATHIICLADGRPVGAARLVFFDEGTKIGRVAVLREYRNSGIGTGIMKFVIKTARERSGRILYANVQVSALDFYKRLGFRPVGEHFLEADIEHVKMVFEG